MSNNIIINTITNVISEMSSMVGFLPRGMAYAMGLRGDMFSQVIISMLFVALAIMVVGIVFQAKKKDTAGIACFVGGIVMILVTVGIQVIANNY